MRFVRNQRGFTLIELMVVVIIIGILAAIAIPTMSKQTDKARVKRAVSELKTWKTIIDTYNAEYGSFPTTAQITGVLTSNGVSTFGTATCVDPWGKPYVYSVVDATPTSYKLVSYGSDKLISGGADDNILASDAANPTESTAVADGAALTNAKNSDGTQ